MQIETIKTTPFDDQLPGTSGLRKKTKIFMGSGYLENFVQSIFSAIGGAKGKSFIVGGDGRYFNQQAIQIILKIAVANGAAKVIVGRDGLLSTPAASHLIRNFKADGGLILSASHNPGGLDEDFGLKFNISNGGPAPEKVTAAMYEATKSISQYLIAKTDDLDLSKSGKIHMGEMEVEIIDPVAHYAELMQTLFDFDKIRRLFASGFTMRFDAMHAVTGPYATTLLEDILGAPKGTVVNGTPLEDFGKGHPDPNPVWAKPLYDLMMSSDALDFGAASDGDGDRNMIVGKGIYVTPSDSLAVLAANAHLAPGYKNGIKGIARSMPTSAASDRVAEKLGIASYETPTGWKFFGNLLDDGKVSICGEESAGTGSDHVREKDGLWAVLLWLNILAERQQTIADILADHWRTFGRNYYSRHDYEAVESDKANALMEALRKKIDTLSGKTFANLVVTSADEFSYHDPVDGSLSKNQGLRINFAGGGRGVLRLSGTGTQGATLRIYLEQYVASEAGNEDALFQETHTTITGVENAVKEIANIAMVGRERPDMIT
ncbi:MAG: alpha-D-glucose phosphate-specific phosphoglucomutase [Hyphomicrobiales bacterium]